jgi:translocation and assembly module TamA
MASASSWGGTISVQGGDSTIRNTVTGYLEPDLQDCRPDTGMPSDAHKRIRDALDALGYFKATFTLDPTAPCDLVVVVDPSDRSEIASWTVATEQPDALFAADAEWLAQQVTLNAAFDPATYEERKRRTLSGLRDRGYIDATFKRSEVKINSVANQADIDWLIDTGPCYTIRKVVVEQDTLDPGLFNRFLDIAPGAPLMRSRLLSTQQNLKSSDYFSRVRVASINDSRASGEIDVRVTATRVDPWSVLGGIGFATDSGPRLRAQANSRYVNDRGHRFAASSLIAPVMGHAHAEYRWPYGDPNHQWYALETRFSYEDTDTAASDTVSIGLRRVTRLGRHWTQTTYTDVLAENFDVSTQEGRSQLWLLGFNFTYTSTIDTTRPMSGRTISFDVRGAHSRLFSDNDVLQTRLKAKQILPFLARSRWIFRAEIGATWQDDFRDLPASLRFFAGGDKSIRGFALDSLGPEDDLGEVIGGSRLLVGSAELDIPLRDNWSLALFADAGSAYDDNPDMSHSVGIGVRWYSPLGPIRADLAHPLTDSDQAVRLHISIGPDI